MAVGPGDSPPITVSGDVQGIPLGSQIVTALQGRPVASTSPKNQQPLVWTGSAWVPTTLPASWILNAADKASASVQAFTGAVSSTSVYNALNSATVTPTTTYTPDFNLDTAHVLTIGGTGGGTLTLANPLNPPSASQTGWMYMQVFNPTANTTTLTFGTAYFGSGFGLPASVAQNISTRLLFIWHGSNWILMSKTT